MINRFNKLKEWMNKDDINLCMEENSINNGIYTSIDIDMEDVIMSIPHSYIIEYSEIKNERLTELLFEKNYHFVLFLYLEMNKVNSFWKPYINMFPSDVNNHIFYYSEKDIQLLNMTSFKYTSNHNLRLKEIKNNIKIMYEFLSKTSQLSSNHINKYESFYNHMLYLIIIVRSRLFEYTKNNELQCGLVPYAELLNHSNNENALWYFNNDKNQFEVFALEEITLGEEICLSYGVKNNITLLSNYGFTLMNNQLSNLCIRHPGTNKLVTYTLKDSYLSITMDKDEVKLRKLLKKIYTSHRQRIWKIKNENIKQIFKDEINILKRLLY